MPTIEQVKNDVIEHLFHCSMDPNGPESFEESELIEELRVIAGPTASTEEMLFYEPQRTQRTQREAQRRKNAALCAAKES